MFDAEVERPRPRLSRYWLLTTEGPGFSGGIGVHVHETARMLAGSGVDVTVLHHDPDVGAPVAGFRDGYRSIRFASIDFAHRPIPHANLQGPLRAAREAAHLVEALIEGEGAPDVLEVQDYGALAHGVLKARLMRPDRPWPRVILTAHRPHAHCALTDGAGVDEHRSAFLADAERWCYAAADAVIAPCRYILGALERIGFPVAGAHVVHNPYDADAFAALEPAVALRPETLELEAALHTPDEPLIFLGKLQAQKGAGDLMAALDALHTEGLAPPVWLLGRDAFLSGTPTTAYDALESRRRRLFAEGRARYLGGYRPADVKALCARHPIVALPYREDALPYAFIEAVLAGAIPLTRATGGQLELAPEPLRARLTADFDRPADLHARLADLRALDPKARRELSDRLRRSVERAVDPARVRAEKLAVLTRVEPRFRTTTYPFVHGPATKFAAPDPAVRRRLAEAVPQRGATLSIRAAGPGLQPGPDLVTVVIPYFDAHAFVAQTLASVEAQDHSAVEVVIVDDGSPSPQARAALDALLQAARRYPTRVLRKLNGGLADARNAGAKVAAGDYLYFLDADDLIHPSTLSRSLAVLKRFDNVGYVGAGLKEFGESENEWAVHDVDGPYLGFHNVQICAFLVRAQAWLAHGFNDATMRAGMEDYESHLRMATAGVRGVAIPEPMFAYRKRTGSMSHGFEPHATAQLYRRVRAANPDFFRRHGPELVGLFAENGHGALAPSVCEPSPAHAALFARDTPGRAEVAEGLEGRAGRRLLSRALRGRCAEGGADWDYTVARLLLALDMEPAFARQLLRAAVAAAPENSWFRLYAMIAGLRDGRIGEATALRTEGFETFRRSEAGAVAWIAGLEAARGFPHVAQALGTLEDASRAPPNPHVALLAAGETLARLAATGERPQALADAEDALRRAGADELSAEATDALVRRWRWEGETGRTPARGVWGAPSAAYLDPSRLPKPADVLAASDRRAWRDLARGSTPKLAERARDHGKRFIGMLSPVEAV